MRFEKIQCGGFYYDVAAFEMTEIDGKKVLTAGSGIMTNGTSEIILNSSTEGSVKQFKITVDDTGKLTATEIEEA